ncbi:MAG: radical SAM protein [Elusimicrobiota bacterium]|nr:radical SAM protein [Elusimicrobiota bacterium]
MKKKVIYGFQGCLSPEFPSQIVVDVCESCNYACIHCPQAEFSKSSAYKGYFLDPKLNKKLVDETASDGKGLCQYLRYTAQGEPLLHPDIVPMLKYACKYSGAQVNLTTNGSLLTASTGKKLLEAGVDVFDVSVDAFYPKTYARIRRKGDLAVTRANILSLIGVKNKGGYKSKVTVSFVEQPLNTDESGKFKDFWEEAGADYVVVRRMHSCAGAKKNIALAMASKAPPRRPCPYPWERLVLKPSGHICFCPADWKHEEMIAHFSKASLREVWRGEFMTRLRCAHLKSDFSGFKLCGQCPDWAATRWPGEGRAYADMMKDFKKGGVK